MKRRTFATASFVLLGAWCLVWVLLSYIPLFAKHKDVTKTSAKTVLFVNFPTYYDLEKAVGSSLFKDCANPCNLSIDKSVMSQADAVVVFTHEHILTHYQLDATKSAGQKWIFFAVESPPYAGHKILKGARYQNKFDYMMTYRRDSDLFFGYLKASKRRVPATKEERLAETAAMKAAFAKKDKMAAWFVSHCETLSKREKYVEELRKYMEVDVFGACGDLKCDNRTRCDQMVSDSYKFYLSFENTLCRDYVSEKLLKILDTRLTVPVVRGGADYANIVPPNSVVNTAHFASPAKLAEHLKQLAADEAAYLKKLEWSWDYQVSGPVLPMCDLCDLIHSVGPARQPYLDAVKWWEEGACHSPNDL